MKQKKIAQIHPVFVYTCVYSVKRAKRGTQTCMGSRKPRQITWTTRTLRSIHSAIATYRYGINDRRNFAFVCVRLLCTKSTHLKSEHSICVCALFKHRNIYSRWHFFLHRATTRDYLFCFSSMTLFVYLFLYLS